MITKTRGFYIIDDVPHIITGKQRVSFKDDKPFEEFATLEELKAVYLQRHPNYEFEEDLQSPVTKQIKY